MGVEVARDLAVGIGVRDLGGAAVMAEEGHFGHEEARRASESAAAAMARPPPWEPPVTRDALGIDGGVGGRRLDRPDGVGHYAAVVVGLGRLDAPRHEAGDGRARGRPRRACRRATSVEPWPRLSITKWA